MSFQEESQVLGGGPQAIEGRSSFLMKTYLHLMLAIGLFVGLEAYFFQSGIAQSIIQFTAGMNWLLILGAFMIVSFLASTVAHSLDSKPAQYAALAVYVLAWSVMFVPLIAMAESIAPGLTESAALMTLVAFGTLTAVVFLTRKNFSFLRPFMLWGGLFAIGCIAANVLTGGSFELGYWFKLGMLVYSGGAVLYSTSSVMHEYGSHQYVAAALSLFSSIALMLWYVIQLFMSSE